MARVGTTRRMVWGSLLAAALLGATGAVEFVRPASAQGWWPWASDTPPAPRPPPVRREQPPYPSQQPSPGYSPGGGGGQRTSVCLQLEQRLVDEQRRGSQPRDSLPQIENELRNQERIVRQSEIQLERADCYDYFLFQKTLRRTRQCVDAAGQLDGARRRVGELDSQRRQILGLGGRERGYQDDLIRELARNNCGPQYQQEAARRGSSNPFSSLWQDEESGPGRGNEFRSLPFATYRTVCVRLCDGYFFPVSFSTLENHFSRDQDVCRSRCEAPAELYYHQNPGGAMEQAVSVTERRPYTSLKTAFRYRKEYVPGCSCNKAEYTPSPADSGERKAEVGPPSSPRMPRR